MKKIIIGTLTILAIAITAKAQITPDTRSASEIIKEQKAKEKKVKDDQLKVSFVKAGFTANEIQQARVIIKEMDQRGKVLRASKLVGEERQVQRKAIDTEKKEKLIAIVGEEKYKAWQKIRKELAAEPVVVE